jgi:selenocysteine lyase/cysteine desulfurase
MRALTDAAHGAGVEFVFVDGAQSVGMIPTELAASGVDGYAASPHKWVQSPKGLGLLYLSEPVRQQLRPGWVTWGQRRWAGTVRIFEDYGTRDMPEVMALGDALRFQNGIGQAAKTDAYIRMHTLMLDAVDASPGVRWRSPRTWDMGSCLMAVETMGAESPRVQQRLYREHGIVMRAFPGPELNTLRVSPNLMTTDAELEQFLELAGD